MERGLLAAEIATALARGPDLHDDALDHQRQDQNVVRLGSIFDGFIVFTIHFRAEQCISVEIVEHPTSRLLQAVVLLAWHFDAGGFQGLLGILPSFGRSGRWGRQ